MTYEEIDRIMDIKGLSSDPAFDALHFLIEEIRCFDGCPLGVLYPDTATIIHPPEGTDSASLHELGHRHGQYYHDNLSEVYAENFRKAHEKGKGRVLLYAGNRFETLERLGVLFKEGEKGAVEIAFNRPLAMDELYALKDRFYGYGEALPRFFYGVDDIPFIRIEFMRGIDWMTIIGAVMAASVVGTVGAIGYAVYKMSETVPWIMPVSLLGTGLFFLFRAMAKEAKRAIR